MAKKIKELFYWCAYLDLEHTCEKEKTYFWRCSKEIGRNNLHMIRSIAAFFSVISIFVMISASTYFEAEVLRRLYLLIFMLEAAIFILCTVMMKRDISPSACNLLTVVYLLHMLAFGGYIGVELSPEESATVYVAVLTISNMIFTLPPILSSAITALATAVTLAASYYIKGIYWFQSDVINCVGVLILSMLLGWRVNKIRAEEAFARLCSLELNRELERISVTDQLTGLPNHWSFQSDYYKMFEEARSAGKRIGVIMMDVDKFKSYNDNYGHIEGDKCLAIVASAFAGHMREGMKAYRYGGEEFIVLLNDSLCDCVAEIADELRQAVEELAIPHMFSEVEKIVTVSVGAYAGVPGDGDKAMRFVDCADKAMYCSKQKGRNQMTIEMG